MCKKGFIDNIHHVFSCSVVWKNLLHTNKVKQEAKYGWLDCFNNFGYSFDIKLINLKLLSITEKSVIKLIKYLNTFINFSKNQNNYLSRNDFIDYLRNTSLENATLNTAGIYVNQKFTTTTQTP